MERLNNYIAFVDHNEVFLVRAINVNKLSILIFRDEVANFWLVARQVNGDNFILGCINIRFDIYQRILVSDARQKLRKKDAKGKMRVISHAVVGLKFGDYFSPLNSRLEPILIKFCNPEKHFLLVE